ncbi:K(+)-transporting ATPase subunit C [Streptomyces sp. Z26]|uniref:K(+)-transporting ATPase subunit C n=1 Tax=Streptomyces TaxID=1883 RepID=UPI000EF15975|nr:K(+)-transporting ATPase subunit C [Streptomyces sp. Z26]RLL65739.1 K(+)-transporting ATPase subunit C [Streptomyces sp. Z26]
MAHTATHTARLLGASLRALLLLTLVTGVLYPLVVTGAAQALFPAQADGSKVSAGGREVGSALIGQGYTLPPDGTGGTAAPDPRWFQGRPAHGLGTDTRDPRHELLLSGATNLAADNPVLVRRVAEAKAAVVRDNSVPGHPVDPADVPADAVTSSASGLDPHISPRYARLQVRRVARENGLTAAPVARLVTAHTEGRTLGFIGEPRVNVLALNSALRELTAESRG